MLKKLSENQDIWFRAKKYGYGWGLPVKWQGWVVLTAYFLFDAVGCIFVIKNPLNIIWFIPFILFCTIVFIFICWKKGEELKWRWGNKR